MPEERDANDLGFTYRTRKSGQVEILHFGRLAATLRGNEAKEFLSKVEAGSETDAQKLMTRVTGNYKRGNERLAGNHPRNRR
jgi:hypothetical protein